MAPTERTPKRQKLSPTEASATSTTSDRAPLISGQQQDATGPNQASERTSWYSRTWPRKPAPITQVARESISSASNTAIETASIVKDKVSSARTPSRKSSLALTLGRSATNKALPVTATTTTDHAMPENRRASRQDSSDNSPTKISRASRTNTARSVKEPIPESETNSQRVEEDAVSREDGTPALEDSKPTDTKSEIVAPRSWIGWLARTDDGSVKSSSSAKEGPTQQKTNPPPTIALPEPDTAAQPASDNTNEEQSSKQPAVATQRRSWLPVWNNVTAAQSAPEITSPTKNTNSDPKQDARSETTELPKPSDKTSSQVEDARTETNPTVSDPPAATKPTAWVFWSRERPAETTSLKDAPREGELAVSNTESESKPRRASVSAGTTRTQDSVVPKVSEETQPVTNAKQKHESKVSKDSTKSESKPRPKPTKAQSKGASATAVAPSEVTTSRPASPAPTKKSYEHLLLPPFRETLKLPENPTLLQQLARLFYSTKEVELKHLDLIKDPPRIKNALAIGVHGYFPAPLIRSVLGQPTGTSIKFADMAAQSIRRWTKKRGYECQVKTAALEGEGKIAERIDLLWKLLLNWIDEIRKADFVMVACHSQGVPVAIMLVAKLIHFGCINTARVGICAMAGVNMGPFPEFKSRWISGSAGELFEFSDPTSKVSVDYLAALDDVLKYGVKLTYIGSIDDQLVSMESSIFAPVSHPHLYRAVSIDSRLHAPDFVSHLVAFALKLRNFGVQDHGLIRELSAPLAGSLYTGEGHSRLYEDEAIYDLAVSFALETSSMPNLPLSQKPVASVAGNPFILPFAMRGILEEDFVKSDLQDEASQLLKQFDEWKPTTKALKDVKFRLEGIRSKL